jgi:biotin operon repressor
LEVDMHRFIGAAFLVLLAAAPGVPQSPSPKPAGLDTAAIDRAMGRSGVPQAGDVYRVNFPRTDLNVTVGSVKVKPGFALGSWAAFKNAGAKAVVHGDLVLLDAEINPVISALQQHGFDITAVHNHLISESPKIMYVHYWGEGDAATLAAGVKAALGQSKTPLGPVNPAAPGAAAADDLPAEQIQQAIGLNGTVNGGVLGLSQPRPETIQMMGVTMPPSMGMATSINFQSAGAGKVAATGDFVMVADEVNKVARRLRQNGIQIAALHNHLLHGTPELYFMHFWAEGDAATVAAGLKAALAELKR